MPIDPISVATQGYVIKNTPKILTGITVATLGYIKPRLETEELIRKIRGGGKSLSYRKSRPKPVEECSYDLVIQTSFDKINDNLTGEELAKQHYKKTHKKINVDVQNLVYKQTEIEILVTEAGYKQENISINIEKIKVLPIKTFISSTLQPTSRLIRKVIKAEVIKKKTKKDK